MYSVLKYVFIIFILMSFLFISACGSQNPVDAYMDIEKAWADENWSKVWDGFQSESQQVLCGSMAAFLGFVAMSDESMQKKIEKELAFLDSFDESRGFEKDHFIKMVTFIDTNFEEDPGAMKSEDIIEKEVGDERAILISKKTNGETKEIVMVKEKGKWKMVLENPFA